MEDGFLDLVRNLMQIHSEVSIVCLRSTPSHGGSGGLPQNMPLPYIAILINITDLQVEWIHYLY